MIKFLKRFLTIIGEVFKQYFYNFGYLQILFIIVMVPICFLINAPFGSSVEIILGVSGFFVFLHIVIKILGYYHNTFYKTHPLEEPLFPKITKPS